MNLTQSAMLLVALSVAVLLSLAAAAGAVALARWDGKSVPQSLSRGGVAFTGALTLCTGLIGLFLMIL
ncbi:hypothetical protein AB0M31_05190 [Streptomyces sp. NPDC051773]|uniref:hypothetical protein n=1 Tax=Streptomyces sp. NPDC051773 TaxID=3156682 RepID=UPI003440AE7E